MKSISLALLLLFNVNALVYGATDVAYDKELSQFPYPFPVHEFQLASQNQTLTMGYMDIGARDAQNVVVLLHGKNFSGYYWERVAKALQQQGTRVIIPDQIGFGKSTKPKAYQYSFSQLALNTHLLLKHLKIHRYSLVGHSMGGMLSIAMAHQYHSDIKQLVLINPIGLENYGDYAEFKDVNFFYERELNKTVNKARKYQQKNYYDGKWSDAYEALLTPLKGMLNGPDWPIIAWNNALTYQPIFSENIAAKLDSITTKTYLIIGTRDRTGPGRGWKKEGITHQLGQYQSLGKRAHQQLKHSELFELHGIGHMPHYEDYSAFSKVFFPIFE